MKPIYVIGIRGLFFAGGMDSYMLQGVRDTFRDRSVEVKPLYQWFNWKTALNDYQAVKGSYSGLVVLGHSMGAGAASYITDHVKVDRLFMLDTAGQRPSPLGNNTGKVYDFQDTSFALVPKFRPQLVNGQPTNKLIHWKFQDGHMGITYNETIRKTILDEIFSLRLV